MKKKEKSLRVEKLQKQWERILSASGLSMEKGRPPRQWIERGTDNERREEIVDYVGTSNNLVGIEEESYRNRTGKVSPHGCKPD